MGLLPSPRQDGRRAETKRTKRRVATLLALLRVQAQKLPRAPLALPLDFQIEGPHGELFPSPVKVLFACRSKEGRIGAFDFRGD